MDEHEKTLDLERRLQSLICGELTEGSRRELLAALAGDERVRGLLAEILRCQSSLREAAGCEASEERIRSSLSAMLSARQTVDAGGGPSLSRRASRGRGPMRRVSFAWGGRAAAAVVIAASLYVAVVAHRVNDRMEARLQKMEVASAPALTLAPDDLARYQTIWNQVAEGQNTYLLMSNGAGEFGTMDSTGMASTGGKVVLMQCRISDERGGNVYTADLLLPDQPVLKIRLPNAGRIAGRQAILVVTTEGDRATVGVLMANGSSEPAGVMGQAMLGSPGGQIGSFRIGSENFRVFVRAQRLGGFRG